MYHIGDKIVYPLHGAGVIEGIEEKDKTQNYYILKIPYNNMKLMVPTDNCDAVGIRDIIDKKAANDVINDMKNFSVDLSVSWNKRQRENLTMLKSGDIYEVAHVVKGLMVKEKEKGLSGNEKKTLISSKQILISELVMSLEQKEDEVEEIIEHII